MVFLLLYVYRLLLEASRGEGVQSAIVKATGCGFNARSRKWHLYLNLYFYFFALVSKQSAALSSVLNTQCFRNSEGSGERSGLNQVPVSYPTVCEIQSLIFIILRTLRDFYYWPIYIILTYQEIIIIESKRRNWF